MYKIQSVQIDNFWHRFNAVCNFNEDVNIIIGRNGTGKTTFMNILYSVLAVDVEGIIKYEFETVTIILVDENRTETVKVRKVYNGKNAIFPLTIEYQIAKKTHQVRGMAPDNRKVIRRRNADESKVVKKILAELVLLSSLSVYRLQSGQDYEIPDRYGRREVVNPVDYKLRELLNRLTHYQLELLHESSLVASKLQRDVLTSILYSEDKDSYRKSGNHLDFDKKSERKDLIDAYTQLKVMDATVKSKIDYHVNAIDTAIKQMEEITKQPDKKIEEILEIDFRAFESLNQTKKIIKMSLDAELKTSKIFSKTTLFIDILKEFVLNKIFGFHGGELIIKTTQDEKIPFDGLSSGEKQLLILLIETLLQKQIPYVFLTDEPELSLHIEWQRKIIPAIKKLNPNAQIIAATHSPEVASNYKDFIFNMEELVND